MQQSVRIWGTVVVIFALAAAAATPAQDDVSQLLRKAVELTGQQEYVAAQETLGKVDRGKLSAAEQEQFDRLQKLLPQASAGSEKAAKDLASAEKAFEEGRWDAADALYQSVQENEFAQAAAKAKAAQQRQRVAEKKRLAQAAEPSGVVEGKPASRAAQEPPKEAAPSGPAAPAAAPPAESRRLTPIGEMKQIDDLLWQRAVARSQQAAAQTREAIAQKKFVDARQAAEQSLQYIEAAKSYAEPVAKYVAAKEAAERLKQEVADAAQAYETEEVVKGQKEIKDRIAKRRAIQEQQRRDKIDQLFNTAKQLRQQQKFREAAEILRQILHIDPANAQARAQLDIVEDYDSLMSQKEWEGDLYRNMRQALTSADEALVPWDYEVLYPRNWLELTRKRSASGIGTGGEAEDSELNRKLDEILPEFNFEDAPLEAVIEHLQEIQKINIAVNWEDLIANGIEKEKAVTVQLRNLPFRTVLKEVLAQVGGDTRLAFSISDGLLRIATKDKLDKDKHVLVYDIRDLLVNVPRFTNAARMDPSQAMNQNQGMGGGGGGSQLFQGNQGYEQNQQGAAPTGDIVQRIMEIIRQTVEPDSWVDTGGGDGSIRELNGQLIIYNTSDAHSQIRGLLDQLRAASALQIAMEARFLNVVSNFLEQFGVDLDFVFNSGTAGYDRAFSAGGAPITDPFTGASVLVPRPYSQIGTTPLPPAFGSPLPQTAIGQPYGQAGFVPPNSGLWPHMNEMTPVSAQQGSMALTDPNQLNTGVPNSFAQRVTQPALNIAGSFLDNLQVDFLIRATQANQRSSIVQAPRLVMFNGQKANIVVARGRQYVASVEPVVAEGVASVRPIPGNAQSGTVLDVEGTISADRRYITLTVITTQADEPSFERFEVQRPAGNSPGIFQLLPSQSWVTVNTTVSIPDGGTVLLGGMKQVGDVEVEAGVPILSKIPILKRAFTNTTTIKDTRTLLILMKAKIIIQKEAEEEAFPTFSATGGS
jgi:general secretion pathway protein D